jgi:hypothetical protein
VTSDGELGQHHTESDESRSQDIDKNKDCPPVFSDEHRESPDVAQADSRTCGSKDKSNFGAPYSSCALFLTRHFILLLKYDQQEKFFFVFLSQTAQVVKEISHKRGQSPFSDSAFALLSISGI